MLNCWGCPSLSHPPPPPYIVLLTYFGFVFFVSFSHNTLRSMLLGTVDNTVGFPAEMV